MQKWERVSVVFAFNEFERLHHAGLSEDGRYCFIASCEDDYGVVDVLSGEWLWTDMNIEGVGELPSMLDEWVQDGWIDMQVGPVPGKYRVFGLFENFPIVRAERLGVELNVDVNQANLHIRDIRSGAIAQTLSFETSVGDWAFASFSDDLSTIAVIEPYYVTLFKQGE